MELLDYLKWRNDISLSVSPFNDIDNVILSYISYMNFDEAKGLLDDYFWAFKEEKVEKPVLLLGRSKEKLEKLLIAYMGLSGLLWSLWCAYKMKNGQEFGEYSLRMFRYFKDAKRVLKF